MVEVIKGCLILNIVTLSIMILGLIVLTVWYFIEMHKKQKEIDKLKESRDFHIKELTKRSGEVAQVGFDMGDKKNVDLH